MKKTLSRLFVLILFYLLYILFAPFDHQIFQVPSEIDDESVLDPTANVYSQSATGFTFVADKFKYCSMLNNSTFDGSAYIYDLGGSIAQINPDTSWFYNFIDYRAAQVEKAIASQHSRSNREDAKRFACYSTAIGNSHFVNISRQSLLISIDPVTYFQPILPAINLKFETGLRKFKLAFLIMVHEIKGFKNLVELLNILDDGDAIILIHVDGKSSSAKLYYTIEGWIKNRKAFQESNVHLAKFRMHNLWGHSSLVLTQLSGFWELKELADWDFVINLSNYDWPLKRNKQAYDALELGRNYIEYWLENGKDHMTERIYRPHLKEMDTSMFHLEDIGVINSNFPRWKYIKHHQWMIITPEYVEFLKTNLLALNFLAFTEHSYIPDEMYFGTVLINSPELSHTIVNQNKRYIRISKWSSHPSWLGWADRSLFPYGEETPSFFYIRKFNALGNVFQEPKLIDWIKRYHFSTSQKNCTVEDISADKHCLRTFASDITNDNHIIITPVSRQYLVAAANLGCSLRSLGKQNVIFWSLDLSIHQALLSVGSLSIFLPGFENIKDTIEFGKENYHAVLRYMPVIMRYILGAGFDVTLIEPDSIITSYFFRSLSKDVDIFFSGKTSSIKEDVEVSSSFMHFKNNDKTLIFIKEMEKMIKLYPARKLEWVLNGLIQNSQLLEPNGFRIVYPDLSQASLYSDQIKKQGNLKIEILDPTLYVDWKSELFNQGNTEFDNVRLIRYAYSKSIRSKLQASGLWYVSDLGQCFTE